MTGGTGRRVVIDSSALVALLADAGAAGQWVARAVSSASLAAPALLPFEVGNILRRHAAAGLLDPSAAAVAHAAAVSLPVDLVPYEAVAERVWQLRQNLTVYDAAYVAVAEALDAVLITLDGRLSRAPGPRCAIATYEVAAPGN